jgi:hypothetical protein
VRGRGDEFHRPTMTSPRAQIKRHHGLDSTAHARKHARYEYSYCASNHEHASTHSRLERKEPDVHGALDVPLFSPRHAQTPQACLEARILEAKPRHILAPGQDAKILGTSSRRARMQRPVNAPDERLSAQCSKRPRGEPRGNARTSKSMDTSMFRLLGRCSDDGASDVLYSTRTLLAQLEPRSPEPGCRPQDIRTRSDLSRQRTDPEASRD